MRKALLLVQRHWIINRRADVVRGQVRLQRVAFAVGHAEGELVPRVATPFDFSWQHQPPLGDVIALAQVLEVLRGVRAARGKVAGEMAQLDPEQRGVQRVHPEVAADGLVIIFRRAAVHAKDARALGQAVVVGGDHAAVAEPT